MSEVARRVSSRTTTTAASARRVLRPTGSALALHAIPLFVLLPIGSGLIAGNARRTLAGVASMGFFYLGAQLMRRGVRAEAAYDDRLVATAPRPLKLVASMVVAFGTLVLAFWGADQGLLMACVFAGFALVGCRLAYGGDPWNDKGVTEELAERAGIRTQDVVVAIAEAEDKIREIGQAAGGLRSRELRDRLGRIVTHARAVLAEIEKDPGDLRRARRFLVTYLDGTRDVVRKYEAQQAELAETPLAENFRRVLETVEQAFIDQEDVLKRNEVLDLEVQIEVLQTQLQREGLG